ncbi:hypothetical protein M2318_002715 [Metapseudomonas resinovorans]|uniref:hypothetical protein n=1 Tax=Metapseudomonas resinovorans TaxID=53412 RepID=UPI003D1A89DD
MADLKLHKVVSSLPGVLEADSIYLVRVASGYDLYATNHSGTIVSYPLNLPTKASLGLDQVNNTSDANKPVSTAQQAALDGKQAQHANLTAISAQTGALGKVFYFTATGAGALADSSVFGRSFWNAADNAAGRALLALGNSATRDANTTPTANTLPLRDASNYLTLGRVVSDWVLNATQPSGNGGGRVFFEVGGLATISPTLRRVAMDTSANQFRIYEAGDSARGCYIDLTTCAAGANSSIWHSGNFNPATKQDALGYTPVNKAGDTLTGVVAGPSTDIIGSNVGARALLQALGGVGNGAFIALHRNGIYACYFGLDTDNKLKVGGWSMGNNAYEIWHAQNTPKQSSTVDLTTGAMLANGSWGVGGNTVGGYADANAIPAGSGFFNVNTSPYSNLPSATSHHVIHLQSATVATELGITTNNASSSRISLRSFASAAWGAWRELAQLALPNTWTAKQTFNDFTQLGDTAPAIKQKKLTGTTAATEGGSVSVNHGVTSSKVTRVSVLVFHSGTNAILPGWVASAGYQYDVQLTSTGVQVVLHATNSENILSKSFTVVIDYEE